INVFEKQMNDDAVNPRDLKRKLAREIVGLYYGEDKAVEAEKEFDRVFIKKEVPTDIDEFEVEKGKKFGIVELLKLSFPDVCSTTGEARRLIKNGGVSLDGKKITDHKKDLVITKESILKVGKRHFRKLIPK
ncbi:tyrosine--tRNA ligase, partial [bacterium]|nr:tyrosine--tRNA ligase [bacterium]